MRLTIPRRLGTALRASAVLFLACPAAAQERPATDTSATSDAGTTPRVNLAIVAEPSASYVSGDTSLAALHDGYDPTRSRDSRRGSYGNWNRTGTQWVQYEWSRRISTDRIDVYWWDDRRGVRLPSACRLLYFDGQGFVPVSNPSGLGTAGDRYNTTTFDEAHTTKLRLEVDSDGSYSTGILEWKVYDSGKSPAFPPAVTAGVDRVVVLGGKTYLNGEVTTLRGEDGTRATWSRASGPGTVAFADEHAPVTTATFSESGDYVLELTAATPTPAAEGPEKGAPLSGSSTLAVKVVPPPPKSHLAPVPTKRYRIQSALWNGRAKALIVNWIPHCIAKIADPDLREGGINNFVEAAAKLAGKSSGGHRGYVFSNAWVYNTVESICLALMIDPQGDQEIIEAQKAMKATLDDWIPKILAAQEPDGYLQTAFTLSDRQRWSPRYRSDHEGYVAGYLLEAAIAHYRLTGGTDRRLFDAARRLGDCWYEHIGPPPRQEWYDGHQAMEMALVRFGRFVNSVESGGKGDRYIELAKFLLDCRRDGSKYDQSHVPVVEQYEAVGHAVRAVYSYAAMADVAMETGNRDYQSAVLSLWDNIVNRKYYVTGGVGSGETSEGFGPDYSLRHNAYCESCSSCGEIFFQHKLSLTYHDARFADLYEETLYNALLGSVDLDGRNFYYQNPLSTRRPRYDWHGCPCCVGNIPRTLLMLPTWMYARTDDSICVNLFVGSTVTVEDVAGTDVELVQVTDYPWRGDVSIAVHPKRESRFSLKVRVPNRDVSELYTGAPSLDGVASISVNGETVSPGIESGYAVITRQWRSGDRIELELPMKIQRVRGSEKIAATAGQVALRYGPIVYCAESVDQRIDGVLSPEAGLKTEWRGDLLGGVVVIKGKWADGSELTAVPYYARANRIPATSAPDDTSRSDRRPGRFPRGASSSVWLRERE